MKRQRGRPHASGTGRHSSSNRTGWNFRMTDISRGSASYSLAASRRSWPARELALDTRGFGRPASATRTSKIRRGGARTSPYWVVFRRFSHLAHRRPRPVSRRMASRRDAASWPRHSRAGAYAGHPQIQLPETERLTEQEQRQTSSCPCFQVMTGRAGQGESRLTAALSAAEVAPCRSRSSFTATTKRQ